MDLGGLRNGGGATECPKPKSTQWAEAVGLPELEWWGRKRGALPVPSSFQPVGVQGWGKFANGDFFLPGSDPEWVGGVQSSSLHPRPGPPGHIRGQR